MGLLDWMRGQFIDIIEWLDDSNDTLVWRFPRHNNEIKNGAKLIVREGQAAVFIDQGQVADVFEPGMFTLDTANLPTEAPPPHPGCCSVSSGSPEGTAPG